MKIISSTNDLLPATIMPCMTLEDENGICAFIPGGAGLFGDTPENMGVSDQAKNRAKFIVNAVNNHNSLIKVLEDLLEVQGITNYANKFCPAILERAGAILKAAKAGN